MRNSIQLSFSQGGNNQSTAPSQGGRRKLLSAISEETELVPDESQSPQDGNTSERRLTRSAFTKTLLEREMEMTVHPNDGLGAPSGVNAVRHRISVFDIRGLARLRETFLAIDNSVKEVRLEVSKDENGAGINILSPADHGEACQLLLRHAGAEIDAALVPGLVDLSELVTHAPEAFVDREKVNPPLTKAQRLELRRNKTQFTAGEDNLILRGVVSLMVLFCYAWCIYCAIVLLHFFPLLIRTCTVKRSGCWCQIDSCQIDLSTTYRRDIIGCVS